jgi:hypothetical protein
MKQRFKAIFVTLMTIAMTLGNATVVHAADASEKTDIKITDFTITNYYGKEQDSYEYNDKMKLNLTWDASAYGNELKEGDYFNVKLPDNFKFPTGHAATHFEIKDASGNVVANAVVSPGATSGGTVKVTFTDYVENRYNIKGTMSLEAEFRNITNDADNTFTIVVGEHTATKTVHVNGPVGLDDQFVAKWGQTIDGDDYKAQWVIRINHTQADLQNVIITDRLFTDSGDLAGMKYIPESFGFWEVTYSEYGGLLSRVKKIDISDLITFTDNDTKFEINLSSLNLGNKQYRLEYKTTYEPGIRLRNRFEIQSTKRSEHTVSSYMAASSSGTGQGDLNNKIKIVKVDADSNETKLAGAKFKITKVSDNTSFELTTDAQGEAVSDKLVAGDYKIVEVAAPEGYEINTDEITVSVKDGAATIKTITNTPKKISIPVQKKWIGKEADKVTVHLYADGEDTGKTVELSAANNWKAEFKDVRQYDTSGNEIEYTVKEDKLENYSSKVTKDSNCGFIITNTNTETIDIPVTKTWVGKPTESVEVKLLADGKDSGKKLTLTAAEGWKGTFEKLSKYDEKDGHEIEYSIEEVKIDGYTTGISGSAENGFTITDTISGTVSIPVTKVWKGEPASKVEVTLYADGKEVETKTLSEDNDWQYTFTDLEKYKDGEEINYTVEEKEVEGYTSAKTGDIENGIIFTNTRTGKTAVEGKKVWDDKDNQDGKRPEEIAVNLLANGEVVQSATVSEKLNWQFSFEDLDKYDEEGQEITYTVEEEAVEGYKTSYDGTTITNSYTPETTSVTVKKEWNDSNDKAKKRPDSVKVALFADGKQVDEATLSKKNKWTYTFSDLDKKKDGKDIVYTVKELEVANKYTSEVTGDAEKGFTITNTYKEEETPVKPSKPVKTTTVPVKTGDDTNIIMMVIGGLMSAAVLAYLAIRHAMKS